MKIIKITTTAIRMPIPFPPYPTEGAGTKREWYRLGRITAAKPEPALEYVLVTMETDDGVIGIGEAPTDIGFFGEPLEEVRSAIDIHLAPRLIGQDPLQREKLMHMIDFRGNSCAKSGIDLALHDLVGKALGVPAGVLLGGLSKERVPVSVEISGGPAEAMAQLSRECVEKNVLAFKAKIGGIPEKDAERLLAMREAVGPDVSLRADANQGYSVKEAIRLCRLAEDAHVGLELLEQPVAAWDLDGMAQVRSSVDTLIEADEAAYSIHDVMNIIRRGSADVINIKIGKAGGLLHAKKIAALAEAAGLHYVFGTAFGLAPKIAAKLQLAACSTGAMDAVEFTELRLHESLADAEGAAVFSLPLDEDGCLPVPTGPGLGVTLDEELVERYTVD